MSDAMTDASEGDAAVQGEVVPAKEKKESRLEYYERLSFQEVYMLMDQDAKDQEYLVKVRVQCVLEHRTRPFVFSLFRAGTVRRLAQAKDAHKRLLLQIVSEGIEYAVKKNDKRKAASTSTEGPGYKTLQSFKGETPPISVRFSF